MVSSVLCTTSQVEHTKKHNSIDSESKFVKQHANQQNHFNIVFTYYSSTTIQLEYYFGLNKVVWLEALTDQVCTIV